MKAQTKVSIHNRFDIFRKNIKTGQMEQVAYAENIVLDQMYTRLCARSSYFGYIFFGTGSGTLSPTRTSLFSHLGYKTAVNDAQSKALPTSWWRQKIVLNPEEYVGSTLTEVGIGYSTATTNLVTHAVIRDMNGNPIALTKTAVDVVTIYATVFVTFSTSDSALHLIGVTAGKNDLVNYLIGGTSFPTEYFYADASDEDFSDSANSLRMLTELGKSSALTWTSDVANKRTYTNTYRFAIDAANGHIKAFTLAKDATNGLLRLMLPATGIYSGLELSGIPVGSGNGSRKIFTLPSRWIDASTLVLKLDDVEEPDFSSSFKRSINLLSEVQATPSSLYAIRGNLPNNRSFAISNSDSKQFYILSVNEFGLLQFEESIYINHVVSGGLAISFANWTISDAGTEFVYSYGYSGGLAVAKKTAGVWGYFDLGGTGYQPGDLWMSRNGEVVTRVWTGNGAKYQIFKWNGSTYAQVNSAVTFGTCYGGSDDGTKIVSRQRADGTKFERWEWNGSTTYALNAITSVGATVNDIWANSDCSKVVVATPSGIKAFVWNGTSYDTVTDMPSDAYDFRRIVANEDLSFIVASILSSTSFSYTKEETTWVSNSVAKDFSCRADCDYGFYLTSNLPYLVNLKVSLLSIAFDDAPANGAVITADYMVKGIHKTAQRVIDLYAEIVFGEVT